MNANDRLSQYALLGAGAGALPYIQRGYGYAKNLKREYDFWTRYKRIGRAPPRRKYKKRKRSRKAYKSRKRRRGKRGKVNKVCKQVRSLQQRVGATTGKCTRYVTVTAAVAANDGESKWFAETINSGNILKNALKSLRFYDENNPLTLKENDGGAGTFTKKFYIKNVNCKFEIRNQYKTPLKYKFYICRPKGDIDEHALDSFNSGIADQTYTPLEANVQAIPNNNTQYLVSPTDIAMFNRSWNIEKIHKGFLQAGQTANVNWNSGPFVFDPETLDNTNTEFHKSCKSACLMGYIRGMWGRGSTTGTGLAGCGITIFKVRKITIEYDAGTAVNDIIWNNLNDAVTGTVNVWNQGNPVAASRASA